MTQDKISLASGASAAKALDVTRAVLEKEGYSWVPTGGTSAEAHEGGKAEISHRSRKLLLGVEATDSQLVLKKLSNGAVGFMVGMGAVPAMRVTRKFRKARRAVEKGLAGAGLA